MKDIAVSLVVDGSFKNVIIPSNMLSELSVKLREEGKYFVHTSKDSYEVEGILVTAKGSKNGLMVLPNIHEKEETK